MSNDIPADTIQTFAKTIFAESRRYGFSQTDVVRLINALLDCAAEDQGSDVVADSFGDHGPASFAVDTFPLCSERLRIRKADIETDLPLLETWINDEYGRHFLLSCATAQKTDMPSLLTSPHNEVGIIQRNNGSPIGAVAFLDIDDQQKRAELRKLIGDPESRGKGYAEEATRLWIHYGGVVLGLEKIYVSTLQTHLRNILLNESIGFRTEGLLRQEVCIEGDRHDVLRMGLCLT